MVYVIVLLMGGLLFPFRTLMPELMFQLMLLPLSALLVILIAMFVSPEGSRMSRLLHRFSMRIGSRDLTLPVSAAFLALGLGLMLYENTLFRQFGYHLSPVTALVSLLVLTPILLAASRLAGGRFMGPAILLCMTAMQMLSIFSFPLHPARSDMLLLIQAAGERFLGGDSPYSIYVIDTEVMLTYLPGLWMTYLPSIALGIDVRFTNVLCLAVALAVILRTCRRLDPGRGGIVFVAAFFLNPWLMFRHDIYMPVFLLQLSLCFSLLMGNRIRTAILVFCWSLCTYQYSWIIFPLFIALLYRMFGLRRALGAIVQAAAAALILIVPFLLWAPDAMIQGLLRTWSTVYQIETYNLSYWILRIIPIQGIKLLQILLVALFCFFACPRIRDMGGFFRGSVFVTLLFLFTSQLIWHYFFLIPSLFMLFHILSRRQIPQHGRQHRSA